MILIHVKHFLTPDGISYFSDWFEQVTDVLNKQKGFVSICYALDPVDQHCVHTWIEFKENVHLKNWTSSQAHAEVNRLLDSYRIKAFESAHYEVLAAAAATTATA